MRTITRRGNAFTLIELLVVIAIIGILAAMLFPVFARARESARKIQCLSNVKNIALAINMYFTDYDRGWPGEEKRAEVLDYFWNVSGGNPDYTDSGGNCRIASDANPFLRREVLLDEYIKNRDVWHCPSAKLEGGASVILGSGSNWFAEVVANSGEWGPSGTFCLKDYTFPSGWGGSVTDTFTQQMVAMGWWSDQGTKERAFVTSIGVNYVLDGANPSSFADAASTVSCHDNGIMTSYTNPGMVAYPDLCGAECNANPNLGGWGYSCAWADESCDGDTWGTGCQLFPYLSPVDGSYAKDPALMKPFTRHLGGSNIGFLDGHAKWWSARAWVDKIAELGRQGEKLPMGMEPWGGAWPGWCGTYKPPFPTFYQP